ncbi:DUF6879 family protein [Yinghuangia soli]|uniref:DUF6879 domain-containing protein n=1 Tax=Yinghuangia soli TaxID=2908204 RepID=A0AA41U5C3_9ACTN|nr:DUF6879 family protein [Yinghuangia soli]MCF2531767.1 hypothetical protein [Yinghuangia soli]
MRACRRSAVHLEMRDAYMLDEAYDDWQAGRLFDPAERWPEWTALMASTTGRGVAIRRARIVSEPVSDYIRYEHSVTTTHNVGGGEQVRWLPRRRATDIPLPGNDFWLFDGETLAVNHFSGDGDWLDVEVTEDPAVVKLCAEAFESVWERAVPHAEYRLH